MAEMNTSGIILAPYGTLSLAAYSTYEAIVKAYEKEFPMLPVRLAFTSPSHLNKMFDGKCVQTIVFNNPIRCASQSAASSERPESTPTQKKTTPSASGDKSQRR